MTRPGRCPFCLRDTLLPQSRYVLDRFFKYQVCSFCKQVDPVTFEDVTKTTVFAYDGIEIEDSEVTPENILDEYPLCGD